MALEIKELTVRINVQEDFLNQNKSQKFMGEIDAKTLKRIIQECTEKVLEKIEQNKER